ncbi:hypothetical protein [Segetibacter koreensis]|uniref:hypothetical protein n=1 Tax=Segetibacter koreensis TaxID=398037 RepID=UPI0004760B90|nr:hypothetical protein [Segetibacter koreensis]
MKPHITNVKHKKFSMLMEDTIQKLEDIPDLEKKQVSEKIKELKNNKNALEEIYANYQVKLKEVSNLLDNYERTQQTSRIQLRKMQLWLKYTHTKLMKYLFQ